MSLTGQKACIGSLPSGHCVALNRSSPTPAWTTLPPCSSLKPARNGFRKVSSAGEEGQYPIPGLAVGVLEMRVKEGSKIRNLLGFAMARMQGGAQHTGQTALNQVLFTGSGRAITKTITCAEIMKRQIRGLHQVSKVQYRTVREEWESRDGACSRMTIHRMVPAICILLSKEPLDPHEPGYQPPEELYSLSQHSKPKNQPPEELYSLSQHSKPKNQPAEELQPLPECTKPEEHFYPPSDHNMLGYQPSDKPYILSHPRKPAEPLYFPLLPPKDLHSLFNRSKLGNQTSAEPCPLPHPHQAEEELCSLSEDRESAHRYVASRKRPLSPCSPSSQPKAKAALFQEGNI